MDEPATLPGQPVVHVTTFDGPRPSTVIDYCDSNGNPVPMKVVEVGACGGRVSVAHGATTETTISLASGRRVAGVLITNDADGLVQADGELFENPEGPAPGVSTYVFTDAVGTSYCYDRVLADLPADPGTYGAAGVEGPVGGPTGNTLNTPNNELFYIPIGLGVHTGPTGRSPESTSASPGKPSHGSGSSIGSGDGTDVNTSSGEYSCACGASAVNVASVAIATVDGSTALVSDGAGAGPYDYHANVQYIGDYVPANRATIYIFSESDCEKLRQAIREAKADLFHTVPSSPFWNDLRLELDDLLWAYNIGSNCGSAFGYLNGLSFTDPRSLKAEPSTSELEAHAAALVEGFARADDGPSAEDLERASGIMDIAHKVLDVIGLVPIVGEGADLVNGVLYLADGDTGNAAISFAGMVPGGDAAKLGRGVKLLYTGTAKGARALRKVKVQPLEVPIGQPTRAKPGPKTDPDAPHNAKIRSEGDKLEAEGNEIVAGGGREKEKLQRTPGGHKEARRPDIIYKTPDGELRGRNIGKTNAGGDPVKREREALEDLNGPGNLPTEFVPYK